MNEKYDRNLQIYKEKEAGTTFRALADKYKLSREAIFNIVKRFRIRKALNIKEK